MKSINDNAKELALFMVDISQDEEDKTYFIRLTTRIHNSEIQARIDEIERISLQENRGRVAYLEGLLKKEKNNG